MVTSCLGRWKLVNGDQMKLVKIGAPLRHVFNGESDGQLSDGLVTSFEPLS